MTVNWIMYLFFSKEPLMVFVTADVWLVKRHATGVTNCVN